MIAVVIKRFVQDGRPIEPGTVVDTARWRNTEAMLKTRMLRPASDSEIAGFRTSPGQPSRTSTRSSKPAARAATGDRAPKRAARSAASV